MKKSKQKHPLELKRWWMCIGVDNDTGQVVMHPTTLAQTKAESIKASIAMMGEPKVTWKWLQSEGEMCVRVNVTVEVLDTDFHHRMISIIAKNTK